jgi:MoxR-like ATPase
MDRLPMTAEAAMQGTLADWRARARVLEAEVGKAVVGQGEVIRLINIAVFARGHVLLEGDVGVGKTTLLRAFARAIGGGYARVEGTVDMMPADLVYHTYLGEDGRPRVEPGPLLQQGQALSTFFFNEINRTRPQVQSLLLRVMAERSLSAFNREHAVPHLLVFADRNRVEREETFELAAAARDRFMFEVALEVPSDPAAQRALLIDPRYHDTDALVAEVAQGVVPYQELGAVARAIQQQVQAAPALQEYLHRLWQVTREPQAAGIALPGVDMQRLVAAGASPRAMSMLARAARVRAWLEGRDYVVPEDVQSVFAPALAHRIHFTPVYEMRRAEIAPLLVQRVLASVPAP